MKVLAICIEFPPVNTTGSYRIAGFLRHFLDQKHEVKVITTDTESGLREFKKDVDTNLLHGLTDAEIIRLPIKPMHSLAHTKNWNRLRIWLAVIDNLTNRWYYGSNKSFMHKTVESFKPDLILFSLPPFSVAKLVIKLKKKYDIPIVVDMRDAWSNWSHAPYSTRIHYYLVKNLEKKLFNAASVILGVTKQHIIDMSEQHPEISSEKFKLIYNGFDTYDKIFGDGESIANNKIDLIKDTNYRVGYIGSFYFDPKFEKIIWQKWFKRTGLKKLWYVPRKESYLYRSPYFFLKALSNLKKKNGKSKYVFEYIGKAPIWLDLMIADFDLQDNYVNHGFKSKQEVLEILSSWDSVLATSEKVEGRPHFCLPSKIFDAVNSGKRIFAFLTPGAQMDFLKNYEQTIFFNPDNVDENSLKLQEMIQPIDYVRSTTLQPQYHREFQANKLLKILEQNI